MNLKYAWDFNGILIPALLGLMWHDPSKVLMSCVECVVLLCLGMLVIRMPVFRRMTIQGSRQLLFFFTICFVYRLTLCHVLPLWNPTFILTDAFGTGYLLSTLMATKIHSKKKAIAMILGTTKISMVGAVAGSLIGFAFYCGPRINFAIAYSPDLGSALQNQPEVERFDQPIHQRLRADKTLLYQKRKAESYQPPVPNELNTFYAALQKIRQVDAPLDDVALGPIAEQLGSINYQLTVVSDRYLYLKERSPANGWGMYVIDTHSQDGVGVQVPAPLDEWSTLESGACLLGRLNAKTLAIAGSPRRVNFDGDADVVTARNTMFEVFHEVFGQPCTMQVRGYTRSSYRRLVQAELGSDAMSDANDMLSAESRLYVRGTVPEQLSLPKLKELTDGFDVRWNNSPLENRLRSATNGNFVELILNRASRRRLVGQLAKSSKRREGFDEFETVQQSMSDWLVEVKSRIVEQGTDGYEPAAVEQMLYMDQEVFSPLLELLSQRTLPPSSNERDMLGWLNKKARVELQTIHSAATAQGYGISVIVDQANGESFVAVSELPGETTKGWGTFVFRPQLLDPIAVEIPRPLAERRSFDFGVSLFQRPRGSVLLIAGAHPRANLDGTADISKAVNRTNLFNLVRHTLLRHLGEKPFLITQARAIQAPVDADVVIATDDGATSAANVSPLKGRLLRQLDEDQLSVAFVDGSRDTAGYELGVMLQATSIQISQNKEVVSLWLSPSLRTKFREQEENFALQAQFEACGIDTMTCKLTDHLLSIEPNVPSQSLPASLSRELTKYAETLDVIRLTHLVQAHPNWKFAALVEGDSAFLCVSQVSDQLPTVINLTGSTNGQSISMDGYQTEQVNRYIRSRSRWLVCSGNGGQP